MCSLYFMIYTVVNVRSSDFQLNLKYEDNFNIYIEIWFNNTFTKYRVILGNRMRHASKCFLFIAQLEEFCNDKLPWRKPFSKICNLIDGCIWNKTCSQFVRNHVNTVNMCLRVCFIYHSLITDLAFKKYVYTVKCTRYINIKIIKYRMSQNFTWERSSFM